MTVEFHRTLRAAAIAGLLAGASGTHAQEKRPWVDPPAATAPAPKTETPQPAATDRPAPAPAPAVASKPEPSPELEVARSPKKRLVRAKPKPVVEASRVEERRIETARPAAHRRSVASDRRDRVIREGGEPLELMTLRTIEFPDGRRIQVLTRPNPETMSRLLGE